MRSSEETMAVIYIYIYILVKPMVLIKLTNQ